MALQHGCTAKEARYNGNVPLEVGSRLSAASASGSPHPLQISIGASATPDGGKSAAPPPPPPPPPPGGGGGCGRGGGESTPRPYCARCGSPAIASSIKAPPARASSCWAMIRRAAA